METETFESRIAKLERIFVLQQQLIDKLSVATFGHQRVIEALATLLHIEIAEQPAPRAGSAN